MMQILPSDSAPGEALATFKHPTKFHALHMTLSFLLAYTQHFLNGAILPLTVIGKRIY